MNAKIAQKSVQDIAASIIAAKDQYIEYQNEINKLTESTQKVIENLKTQKVEIIKSTLMSYLSSQVEFSDDILKTIDQIKH